MAKRETAWSEAEWGEYRIGGKSASAVKEELEYEMAMWCAHELDNSKLGVVLIDGEEYSATISVKLQRVK